MRKASDNVSPMMLKLKIVAMDEIRVSCLHKSSNCSDITLEMQLLSQCIYETIALISRCFAHDELLCVVDGETHITAWPPPTLAKTPFYV
jgi:hypothetical protein